jgi:hypothetical protein
MDLFSNAKAQALKPTKKGSVEIDNGHVLNNDQLFDAVQRYRELLEEISDLTTEKAILYDELKEHGTDRFLKEYNKTGAYPKSVTVTIKNEDRSEPRMLAYKFIPTTRCTKVDDTKKVDLQDKYGDDIVRVITEFSFNSEVLKRNQEALSKLIGNSDDISEDDKKSLIKADVKYIIKPELVKSLTPEQRTPEFISDIGVISMIKNPCEVQVPEPTTPPKLKKSKTKTKTKKSKKSRKVEFSSESEDSSEGESLKRRITKKKKSKRSKKSRREVESSDDSN